jgi:rhamnosyl/mannosyltransferase
MPSFLHLYRRYWPDEGGIEWTMRACCEYVAAQGHDVTALVSSRYPWTREETHHGVRVIRSATLGTIANTPLSPPLSAWVRHLRPDLVEYHHPYPFGLWSLLQARPEGRLVFHYHMDISRFGWLQALVKPTLDRALARADRILVNSRGYAETSPVLQPWLDKCEFIPPSVSPEKLELTAPGREQVARLRRDDRFRVLFVGRLSPYKGLQSLVEAMQWVDGHLTIIGRGELAGELPRLAARLGIADRVRLAGRVSDDEVVCHYHAADVTVLPSVTRGESFGVTQVEAMLCGKPVVVSDLPGVGKVGEDGVTCRTFPRGDAQALAAALNALAADPASCRRMGQAGRRRALELYHPATLLRRRLGVYESLLGRSLTLEA